MGYITGELGELGELGESLVRQNARPDPNYVSFVRIFNQKQNLFHPRNRAIAPDGNIYFHPKGKLYSDNFGAKNVDINLKGLFIHELTHVWQHQSGKNVFAAVFDRRYNYNLVKGKPFTSYGLEQQGSIVEDYYYSLRGVSRQNSVAQYEEILPFKK